MAALRTHTFAEATKRTYTCSIRAYILFCQTFQLRAFPASSSTLCRYVTFLARDKAYTTIQQYLSTIRLVHLELGFPHPFRDNHPVSSLLKAVKRVKGATPSYKRPLSHKQLIACRNHLDLTCVADAQLWTIILTCFFGLLRISNVTVPSADSWDEHKILRRMDIEFRPTGGTLRIRWSKTIQFKDKVLIVALPVLKDNPLCPITAMIQFFTLAGKMPQDSPAFAFYSAEGVTLAPTPAYIRSRLQTLLKNIGLPTTQFNTHSLRRSGACYLLSNGTPLEVIKVLGDWKSDSVFDYLKPSVDQKLAMCNKEFADM